MAQQIVRALNLILIKTGTGPATGVSFCALLNVLSNCTPDTSSSNSTNNSDVSIYSMDICNNDIIIFIYK